MKRQINDINLQKHLTPQELLDYTQDVLGNDEMYRLELHLNECELCSDAAEGTILLSSPIKTTEEIQSKILPIQHKKHNVNYLAIAASISLITVFGLSYWLLNKNDQSPNIAENTGFEQKDIVEEMPVSKKEPINQNTDSEKEVIEEELAIAKSEPLKLNNTNGVTTAENEAQKNIAAPKNNEETNPINEIAINAVSKSEDKRKNADTQQEEEIIEPAEDIAQSNFQPTSSAARSSKKSASVPTPPLEDNKEPVPQGGMNALKVFVAQNLKYPQEAIDNKIKGTVVLEVTISSNGDIKNIIIIKSVGSGCDAEAMRLITVGPKWIPAAANGIAFEEKREVKIKFKN